MTYPLVSVVMAVYNCQSTIIEALESIRDQTYTRWELIICDDSSTDLTGELLKEFAAGLQHNQMTIITNESNRKLAYSLNRCIERASGEYIARMDGDDISEPGRFEQQVEYLAQNSKVDLIGTSMRRFNAQGFGDIVHPAAEAPDKWTLATKTTSPFCHATIMARRSVFETVNNYTVSWRTERGQDLDLWFKFFKADLVGRNLPQALYRVREDAAAIRRRSPKARLGGYVTRVKGGMALHFPFHAYLRFSLQLLKIFIPYKVFDAHRQWLRRTSRG